MGKFLLDIYNIFLKKLKGSKKTIMIVVRTIYMTFSEFFKKKGWPIASSLTYYTLLAIVPVLALSFAIAEKLGIERYFERGLKIRFADQQQVYEKISTFIHNTLEAAGSGIVAIIGLIILFLSVIKLLNNLESFFINIWHEEKKRKMINKIGVYFILFLLVPTFLVSSGVLKIIVIKKAEFLLQGSKALLFFSYVFKLFPYFMIWILFWVIYLLLPMKVVRPIRAFICAVIFGTIYELVQWGYLYFQIGLSKYSLIYSGFASIPFFLIWLQLSWIILLIGAQMSFVLENLHKDEFLLVSKKLSFRYKNLLMIYMIKHLIDFESFTKKDIYEKLDLPPFIIDKNFDLLSKMNLIFIENKKYWISDEAKKLSVAELLIRIQKTGDNKQSFLKSDVLNKLIEILDDFDQKILKSDKNILLNKL